MINLVLILQRGPVELILLAVLYIWYKSYVIQTCQYIFDIVSTINFYDM